MAQIQRFWLHPSEPLFLFNVFVEKVELSFEFGLHSVGFKLQLKHFVLIVLQAKYNFQLVLLVRPLVLYLLVVCLLEIH